MTRLADVARPVEPAFFTPTIRPRILQRIDVAAVRPITLIVAPAGYGKSVALSDWLRTRSVEHVRFDVQAEHCTMLGFARGFAEAFSLTLPALLNTVSTALQSSASSPEPGKEMARWMAAHLKGFEGLIALDDFHRGGNDLEVSRFVASLISQTKSRIRWLLSTRSTLDLPVATWLAYGDADFIIGDRDLTFDEDEIRELSKSTGSGLSDKALEDVVDATSGWPVALGFALRSSRVVQDAANIANTTREMLFQYLAEQVYDEFSEDERELLHFASYLPSIEIAVLNTAGRKNGGRTLESIRRRATFLSLEQPGFYKCHDLFRDFLCRHLEISDASRARRLQLEAAGALERVGNIDAALRLYVMARAVDHILRMLRKHGFDLIDHSHGDVVEVAIRALPQDIRTSEATVLGLRAQREADSGLYDRAGALFERAARNALDSTSVATLSIRLAINVLNQGHSIASILEPLVSAPSPSLRAEILGLLSAEYSLRGYVAEATTAIDQAELLSRSLENDAISAKVSLRTAVAGMNIGLPIAQVRNAATTASDLADRAGLTMLAGHACTVMATASLFLENDLKKCIHYAAMALERAIQSGSRFNLETALFQLACAETQNGDEAKLRDLVEKLAEISHPASTHDGVLHSLRATLLAWHGEVENADRLMDLFARDDYSYYDFDQVADRALHSMYSIAAGNQVKALMISAEGTRRLKSVRPAHAYAASQCEMAEILFATVQILAQRKSSGRRSLLKALGRSNNVAADIFGRAILPITQTNDPSEWERACSLGLKELASYNLAGLARSVHLCVKLSAAQILREAPTGCPLTPAELRIMRAIDRGQTAKDVAVESGRSPHTVRTLIQRATTKLGCSGRQEALSTLRRRGLLSTEQDV